MAQQVRTTDGRCYQTETHTVVASPNVVFFFFDERQHDVAISVYLRPTGSQEIKATFTPH